MKPVAHGGSSLASRVMERNLPLDRTLVYPGYCILTQEASNVGTV